MEKRIVYPNGSGGVAILVPADCGLSIKKIAAKDVPDGVPFKIVNVSDIPQDRAERDALTPDMFGL